MEIIDNETGEILEGIVPAYSQEARENYLIALAYDAVEERIKNGTATSQELVHFLRLGTQRERIEREILDRQKDLITAKTEALQAQRKVEDLFTNALEAFKVYSGNGDVDEEDIL